MAARPSLDILKDLNVVAVSLANNHSHDFGDLPCRTMQHLLADAGLIVLENGTVKDFGPFRLAALTDLDNRQEPVRALLGDADLDRLDGLKPDKPRFAFLHWGEEFRAVPGPREQALAARLAGRGRRTHHRQPSPPGRGSHRRPPAVPGLLPGQLHL